jgi:hypothetical protein
VTCRMEIPSLDVLYFVTVGGAALCR